VFERIHSGSYRRFGYELIDIPAAAVADRAAAIQRKMTEITRRPAATLPGRTRSMWD
jgi:hypothetical protein